jgi:hypothetical protein
MLSQRNRKRPISVNGQHGVEQFQRKTSRMWWRVQSQSIGYVRSWWVLTGLKPDTGCNPSLSLKLHHLRKCANTTK